MTCGNTEQSSKNWQNKGDEGVQYCEMIFLHLIDKLWRSEYFAVNMLSFVRVSLSAKQIERIWGISSIVEVQSLDIWQYPVLLDHLLHRYSVLYLPESILACTVAMAILAGEEPAVDQIACGLVKNINCALKYVSEDRVSASALILVSQ